MTDSKEDNKDMKDTDAEEMALLKERATQMKISFHPTIGLEKLKEKINAVLVAQPTKVSPMEKVIESIPMRNARLRREANRLIRCNVTCMNPSKKEWPGEIFSVGNAVIGTIKKFIPFGTEVGFHIPSIILDQMKDRKYQAFKTIKLANGQKHKKGSLVKEFAIDVLENLTKEEIQELANRQMAAGSVAP